jgi:hypothetical protein
MHTSLAAWTKRRRDSITPQRAFAQVQEGCNGSPLIDEFRQILNV